MSGYIIIKGSLCLPHVINNILFLLLWVELSSVPDSGIIYLPSNHKIGPDSSKNITTSFQKPQLSMQRLQNQINYSLYYIHSCKSLSYRQWRNYSCRAPPARACAGPPISLKTIFCPLASRAPLVLRALGPPLLWAPHCISPCILGPNSSKIISVLCKYLS